MKKHIIIASVAAIVVTATAVQVHAGTRPREPISQSDAERALQDQGVIVVAEVKSREITNPGSRSESAFYTLAVAESLLGQPSTPISAARYTQKKQHYLVVGEQYLLLLSHGGPFGTNDYVLRKFEPAEKTRIEAVKEWLKNKQETGEPSARPYGSPAAGSPSGQP